MASNRTARARAIETRAGEGPTAETIAKLRADAVATLHRKGKLGLAQLQAAEEIRVMWQAIGRGLFAATAVLDAPARRGAGTPFRDPVERLSRLEAAIFARRYRPWSRETSAPLAPGRRATRLQLVLDVVVDNLGTWQADRHYRLRHGTALAILAESLARYAEIAGWARRAARTENACPANELRDSSRRAKISA